MKHFSPLSSYLSPQQGSWRGLLLLGCALLFLLHTTAARALQAGDFTFSHLGKAEGLDNQRIFSLCQTPDGAIWWSSKTSVGRYNGREVKNYTLDQGIPYAHKGARVIKLAADSSHVYAYDSRSYLFQFNPQQGAFQPCHPKKLAHEGLNDLYVSKGKMYLALYDGVFLLQDTTLIPVLQGTCVNKILSMRDHLLFCARDGVYDEYGNRLLPYNVETAYYDDRTGNLWLGGFEDGLVIAKTDVRGQIVDETHVRLSGTLQQCPIRSICPYDDTMLIGIDGLGVYQMPRNGQGELTLLFDANESRHGMLHGNGVYSIIVDRWMNIVIGTYSGGIDIARPIGSTTAIYQHIPSYDQSLCNDHVNTVLPLSPHLLAIGTDNGVSLLNTQTNTWQHCCQGTVALSLCPLPDGTQLVATYGKGIYRLHPDGHAQQLYTTATGHLTDDHVYALSRDPLGNLWIGSLNGDLLQMSPDGSTHRYPIHNVMTITPIPTGQIAVGTAFGLHLINPTNHTSRPLNYTPQGTSDVNIFVNHILPIDHELWIATEGGGIYIWNLQLRRGHQLTTRHGLPSDHVSSLLLGHDRRVWIATEEGLAFVSPNDTTHAVNVNYCHGLSREYVRTAATLLPDHDVIFGSTTGAVVIHPDNVQALNYTATLRLLGISSQGTPIAPILSPTGDPEGTHLRLPYSQRTFDLHFESINLRNHFDIGYRYLIDDGQWSQPFTHQYLQFVSMEPGTHHLTLQCISLTSHTVISTLPLTITIAQPWWNSWWMWCIYILLILLAFYGAWRIYTLQGKYMRLTIDYLQLINQQGAGIEEQGARSEEQEVGNEEQEAEGKEQADNGSSEFVDQVTHLIVQHLSDSTFTIDRLCREMAMSRTLFYVKLKSYTGKSPQDFIRIIRLERAATLLRHGSSVTDAAALTGFDNPKYFSTVFKKYFGTSPSKYQ